MILLRDKDRNNKNRFLNVVDACNAFSSDTRLHYIFDGKNYSPYNTHGEILQAWSKMESQYGGEGLEDVFMLTTGKEDSFCVLGPNEDPYQFSDVDGIEFSFNVSKPLLKPEGYISFGDCREWFIAVINSYEAYAGFIHDSYMEQLTAFGFVQQVYKQQLPEDQWKYIPIPDIVRNTPPELLTRITRLLPPEQFNRLEIPEAIYWFNYWNPYMVKNVGEEKIKTAPCEVVAKQKNGGYILITQKENFDAQNTEHLERLAVIYDHFNLYELQRKNLFR